MRVCIHKVDILGCCGVPQENPRACVHVQFGWSLAWIFDDYWAAKNSEMFG
jgi:hypothetical protein